jgi:hypothetical protein
MIEILKCGPLTTVQDAGRFGYRHLGIVQAGAMDSIAQQQANLLLENPLNAAVLEISLGPLHVKFHHACAIVLMGADFRATLKSADKACALMPGYIHQIPAGAVLRLAQPSLPGMRASMCRRFWALAARMSPRDSVVSSVEHYRPEIVFILEQRECLMTAPPTCIPEMVDMVCDR